MDLKRRDFLSTTAVAATLAAARPLLAQTTPPAARPPAAPQAPAEAADYKAPTEVKKLEVYNVRDLEAVAQKIIPPVGFGYISNAAGEGWTKQENEAAFKRLTIQTRYLTGLTGADVTTTLLRSKLSMPIIVSVMGGHGMAHASAEAGTAKGAHASGTLITVPSEANVSLEEVAKATPGPKWFQIYLPSDRGKATDILQRAKAAGYLAIVLTIDNVGGGSRETEFRNRYRVSLPSGNYGDKPGQTGRSPQKRDLGWDDVAFIQKVTGLPVILKGVMSADLAVEAVQHGCGGIQVSNHGGRNLDDMPATITVLPRIAEAVAGRMPIVMDGGIRRGQDVFKALALGANAVAVGRPILYGLALGGWMGVQAVLDLLKAELDVTMHHVGVRSISEISRRYLV